MHNYQTKQIPSIEFVDYYIGELPIYSSQPLFVFLSGVPGSGKSYLSNLISKQIPIVRLESDFVRTILFPTPRYTQNENRKLFKFCHSLIDQLLSKSLPVLFDATNLIESNREHLYHLAERNRAQLIIIRVTAPEHIIFNRLTQRESLIGVGKKDNSNAGWRIYKRMIKSSETIRRRHSVIDTSEDIDDIIRRLVREIRRYL